MLDEMISWASRHIQWVLFASIAVLAFTASTRLSDTPIVPFLIVCMSLSVLLCPTAKPQGWQMAVGLFALSASCCLTLAATLSSWVGLAPNQGWEQLLQTERFLALGLLLIAMATCERWWLKSSEWGFYRFWSLSVVAGVCAGLVLLLHLAAMVEREAELDRALDHEVNLAEFRINQNFGALETALQRLGERWERQPDAALWRADAESYLEDLPGVDALYLVDSNAEFLESRFRPSSVDAVGLFGQTQLLSALNRLALAGTYLVPKHWIVGQPELVFWAMPLRNGGRASALLVQINLNHLFRPIARSAEESGLHFSFSLGEKDALSESDSSARRSVNLLRKGLPLELNFERSERFDAVHQSPVYFAITVMGILACLVGIVLLFLLLRARSAAQNIAGLSERLKASFNSMHEAILVTSEGRVVDMNKAAEAFLGQQANVLVGELIARVVPELERLSETEEGETLSIEHALRGETKIHAVCRGFTQQQQAHTMYIIRDLSKETAQLAALQRVESLLDTAIAASPLAFAILDEKGRIQRSNVALSQLTGHTEEALQNVSFQGYVPKDQRQAFVMALQKLKASEENSTQVEMKIAHVSGHQRWVHCTCTKITGESDLPALMVQMQDVDEQHRRLEWEQDQHRKLADLNRELEQYNFVASHDLHEPIRTLKVFLGYLKADKNGEDSTRFQEDLRVIEQVADRLDNMIKGLQKMTGAGVDRYEFEDHSLKSQIDRVQRRFKTDLRVGKVEVLSNLSAERVYCDSEKLQLVFEALLENALKFRSDDRKLTLEWISYEDANNTYIALKDNGIGIQSENLDQVCTLFKKWHPSKAMSGVGLGLSVAEKIILKHGGQLRVESEWNVGSIFTIVLPKRVLKNLDFESVRVTENLTEE